MAFSLLPVAALPGSVLAAAGRPWGLAFGLLGLAVLALAVGLVALANARRDR